MYTVVIDGKPQGPYTLDELKKLDIKPGTFIRKPGMDDYKEAHELPELREFMGFRFQQTAPQYFASFDQRLLASAIDYFFIVLIYVALMVVAYLIVNNKKEMLIILLSTLIVIPIAKFLYSSFAEASIKQATIGKRILAIKVGDMFGNRLSLGVSFMRNFLKIFSVLTLFFGYLYSFLNKKQQCLHDVMANTLVVKDRLI